MKKHRDKILWAIGGLIITAIFLFPLFSEKYLDLVKEVLRSYPYLAPLIVVSFRIIGVVLAPLPGSPVGFASIAVLPWWQAWLYNLAGVLAGAVIAFLIARKYREPLVTRFASLQKVHEWQDRISSHSHFWTFTALRLSSVLAFDFVSYAAGLTRVSFGRYLISSILVETPYSFMMYYLGGLDVRYSVYMFLISVAAFILTASFIKYLIKNGQN